MRYYIAVVHKEADSDFGVSFPDFPGCITAGASLAEAAALAAEALGGHIDLMIDEGLTIPEPATLDGVMADAGNREGVPVMIPVAGRRSARAVRVNITLPEDILERIDAYAAQHGMNRSGFLSHAAQKQMEEAA